MSTTDFSKLSASKSCDLEGVRAQLKSLYIYLGLDLASLLPIAVIAILSGSVMLLTDVIDYGKGILSALIAIGILKSVESGRAGRFEHGIGRLSSFGTLTMSIAVNLSLLAGIGIAAYRLFHPHSIENGFTIVGAILQFFGIGINLWLAIRNYKLAKQTNSPLMAATWRMAFADTILAFSILMTICLSYAFSRHWWAVYLDPVCAIAALTIGIGAYAPLLKKMLCELVDLSIDEAHQLSVMRALAKHFDLYSDFHEVKTRYSGGRPHIALTLSFPGEISMDEAMGRVAAIKESMADEVKDALVEVIIVPPHGAGRSLN